jgi:hypothetical protein
VWSAPPPPPPPPYVDYVIARPAQVPHVLAELMNDRDGRG